MCSWLSPNNTPLPENLVKIAFEKFGCRLKCKKNCNCKKRQTQKKNKKTVSCLPICKCWRKFDVLWLKTDIFLYDFVLFYKLIFVYLELNLISIYLTDFICLYWQVQICLFRGISVLTVSTNLVIYNIGIDFSKKDNFISHQLYSLFLMLIERWYDGQN